MPLSTLAVSSPSSPGRWSRRDFLRICTLAAAAVGLPATSALRMAEAARKAAMQENDGKYILVVEGAIPTKDGGIYCKIGGRTALDLVQEAAEHAGAIIAIGSCASFGGIPAAEPNPTGAKGVPDVLGNKPVITLPGCPANPYIFLGTALQYATFGTLPALDELGRPKFAYARTIHEHCPRRPHFDAGRFVAQFGDQGHREGWCLYKMGCKGPQTHASCSVLHFGDVVNAWPIGIGHPCVGCTEQKLAFRVPMHTTVEIERPVPPDTYPGVVAEHDKVSPIATGVAGLIGGALLGAGFMVEGGAEARQVRALPPPSRQGPRPPPSSSQECPGPTKAPAGTKARSSGTNAETSREPQQRSGSAPALTACRSAACSAK